MSALRFLTRLATGKTQVLAAITSSAGAGDGNKIVATGGDGKLDGTLMPTGVGADTTVKPATENLAAGDLVNFHDNGGTPSVRKADASNGRQADGFVLAAVTSGSNATVYPPGSQVTGLTGLTISTYYLSNSTAGSISTTPPDPASNIGHIMQAVGRADSATSFYFNPEEPTEIG
ncbi:MAG: hypothetical protein AAGD09_11540 [Cyanobacteria bacterium P01_F01_bin.56]